MKRWDWIVLLGVLVTVLAVYANGLNGDFCYDENLVILRNDNVQDPDRILSLWSDTYWGSSVESSLDSRGWRPLTIFTFHVNARLGGKDPFGFHLANVILHALASILLFLSLVRLRLPRLASATAAFLFAVHAVHTEAVTQIVGRSELIAGTCALGALLLHLHAQRGSPLRRWGLTASSAALFFMGLLGKESALGFYALVLASDVVLLGGEGLRATARRILLERWKSYVFYILPLVAFLVLRYVLFGRAFPSGDVHFVDNPLAAMHPLVRPLASLLVLGKSLSLLVVPASLSADYGYAQLPVDRFWASGMFWFGLLALGSMIWKASTGFRKHPALLWGTVAFLLAYLPVSSALLYRARSSTLDQRPPHP